jgi:DNA-binding response OmpR family regulator
VPDLRTIRLLLVDDDPAIARIISAVITAAGYAPPVVASTGADGLARAADADIVLLDLQLPDLDGLEVLAQLRARPTPPAIIVVTAHGSETAAARALSLGADDYVIKDASLTDLLPKVVERHRRTVALRRALAAAERDLLAAERMAAVGQMTVTLHHAINNPLMAASAEADLLLRDPALTAEQREGLTVIRQSLERIRDTVRRAGELPEAPATDYLEGSIRMVDLGAAGTGPAAGQRGRALMCTTTPQLGRVLGHLLRHAGFTVEDCPPGEVAAHAGTPAADVRVIVVEGGVVDPAALPRRTEGGPLLVAVGAAAALAALAGRVDFAVGVPFDPGTFVSEVLNRLEWRPA